MFFGVPTLNELDTGLSAHPKKAKGDETVLPSPWPFGPRLKASLFQCFTMPNGARHWTFTWNAYGDSDVSRIENFDTHAPGKVVYCIAGKEIGASGNPHLQGFISFEKRSSLTQAQTILGGKPHLEICRSIPHAIEYCKKDGNYVQFGTPPTDKPNGTRNEFQGFIDAVKGGVRDRKVLRETHANIMARYPRYAEAILRDHRVKQDITILPLRAWQQLVLDYISQPIHPREVVFVVDTKGNAGKSYLAALVESQYDNVQVMRPGKVADMAHEYDETTKILIVDVPKSKVEHFQYDFLECVKDGRLFSPKYDSLTKRFPSPHVLVFMNEEPDDSKLSSDRYKYIPVQQEN